MKNYIVVFMFRDLPFHERTRVYGVDNRQQAIQRVKDHYGTRAVKIISAKTIKYDENGFEDIY